MKKKKVLAIFLAILTILTLIACSKGEKTEDTSASDTKVEDTKAEATQAPVADEKEATAIWLPLQFRKAVILRMKIVLIPLQNITRTIPRC